ncbi:acyl-CoA carboxylase epsilon subunit [Blastococcus mobilis]|uniref:Acyl-CoA carboxylase epsilon subunit n=1 Tax=Blastococcus mobilis TaxID=1938746 RepID=A0A238URR7_9ACTN|nr:acyl-CoA carboxylase epsilon subunit [Blastococcus mobilis]SNR24718.1 Acyl-CoA carboxylase epsilon subunit [Blastococcus mobilis]
MTADLEPRVPAFRVVKGSPTDDEVAALAVLLAALAGASPTAAASDTGPSVVRRPWRRRRTWHALRENTPARLVPRPQRRPVDEAAG